MLNKIIQVSKRQDNMSIFATPYTKSGKLAKFLRFAQTLHLCAS